MDTLEDLPHGVPVAAACDALGQSRATLYRRTSPPLPPAPRSSPRSPRRLSDTEQKRVLDVLHEPRFADQPPAEVYARLLTESIYLCSVRTMYRLLAACGETKERRAQRAPVHREAPHVEATVPNQVWSWDITKLAGAEPGVFYYLYVMIDLFSRYVVGWLLAGRENTALATQFIGDTITLRGVDANALTIHSDRGSPMKSGSMAQLCAKLGVTQSFSRPRISDDNPFSESQFKTMKYQPDYPGRFGSELHARGWAESYFDWYNDKHHHEGLALFTPADVYFGRVEAVATQRQAALDAAYAAHPERFVHGAPKVARPPSSVAINAPAAAPDASASPGREPPPEAALGPSPAGHDGERAQRESRAAEPASEAREPLKRASTVAGSTTRGTEPLLAETCS